MRNPRFVRTLVVPPNNPGASLYVPGSGGVSPPPATQQTGVLTTVLFMGGSGFAASPFTPYSPVNQFILFMG